MLRFSWFLGVSEGVRALKLVRTVWLLRVSSWVLSPLSNSSIKNILWLYITLNRTPNIDCHWVGAVPKFQGSRVLGSGL